MADFDVVVIGGGPAGYSAALKAAERAATVALIEAEQPGGACVHHACIPTNILLDSAVRHVEARELAVMGVIEAGERFNFARAAARKDALVRQMAGGIQAALRVRKVTVIEGRAAFVSPSAVRVTTADGGRELTAEAFIIATGTRWEPPELPGFAPRRVLTADAVQALPAAPRSALVLASGAGDVPFGLEYAALLAIAGASVTVAAPERLIAALDHTLDEVALAAMADLGIQVLFDAAVEGSQGEDAIVRHRGGRDSVGAEVVVAADTRRPYFETLGLAAAGVATDGRIIVDGECRTNASHIFAAGDVTGGVMLSAAASHMGEVAAINATGGDARTRLTGIPRVVHGPTEIAWVGISEDAARGAGYDVTSGIYDLAYNARAVVLGARTGLVKVVAERELGEVLGVHAVGPGASDIAGLAAALMQAEVTVEDMAASVAWHPSTGEALAEAARRACR
ncbi:MAG: NAD(P)/FAD-dependent oxidoreductase [Dehalococcoidia bacterium]|nr:NAD(P)/FAD-dependent oxidoreductase [Dehalococcoidia bacterium]